MISVSEEMYDLMMHMIGLGRLTENFCYVVGDGFDPELLLELAEECNDTWGSSSVDIEELQRAIERYNEEGE